MIILSFIYFLFNNELNYHKRMIKVFELLKNFRTKGYKIKTIRNSVSIGASLLGGCASVETHFDALRVACVKDALFVEKEVHHTPKDLDSPYFSNQTNIGF